MLLCVCACLYLLCMCTMFPIRKYSRHPLSPLKRVDPLPPCFIRPRADERYNAPALTLGDYGRVTACECILFITRNVTLSNSPVTTWISCSQTRHHSTVLMYLEKVCVKYSSMCTLHIDEYSRVPTRGTFPARRFCGCGLERGSAQDQPLRDSFQRLRKSSSRGGTFLSRS